MTFPRRQWLARALMGAALTCAAAAASAETLKIGGSGTSIGTMKKLAAAFSQIHPAVSFEFPPSLGTTGGIKAVTAGAIDIGLSSRALKDEETQAGARQTSYAVTPFVFVTSAPGVFAMTRSGVIQILGGDRTAWHDGKPIRIVLRPESDSDSALLTAYFPEVAASLAGLREARLIPIAKTDQDNLDAAEKLDGSFAATSLCIVLSEGRRVSVLTLDGVAPTLENLETGAYPLKRQLYLVTGAAPSAAAQDFLDFVGSVEGRQILRANGNLPITG